MECLQDYLAEIREKRNLAYAVKGDSNVNKTFAYNLIYVGTMKENVEKVKKLILEEFEKVGNSLEEEEVKSNKRAINWKLSNFNGRFTTTDGKFTCS